MNKNDQDIITDVDISDETDKNSFEEPNLNNDIMFYHDNILHKHDEKLIDKEIIDKKVKKLYDNFHSEEYQNYLKILNLIPKKFMKKNYQVKYKGNEIEIYMILKSGQLKELHKIKGPKYVDIIERLDELEKVIVVERKNLLNKYNTLLIADNVLPLDKNQFVEDKKIFMEHLHEYYAYKKFYMDINNLYDIERKRIILFKLVKDKHQTNDINTDSLEGDDYMIRHTTINKINEHKLNKLNLYNNIVKNLKLQDGQKIDKDQMDNIEEEIRDYLNMKKETENNRLIDLEIKITNNMVKYGILERPSITYVDKLI